MVARSRLIDAIEALKDPQQIIFGEARAVIYHLHLGESVTPVYLHREGGIGGGIPERIIQEIDEHLLNAVGISPDFWHFFAACCNIHSLIPGLKRHFLYHTLHQGREIDGVDLHFYEA